MTCITPDRRQSRTISHFQKKIVNDCQINRFRLPKRQSMNSNKTFLIAIISILAIENVDFGNRKHKIVSNSAFTIAAYPVCVLKSRNGYSQALKTG